MEYYISIFLAIILSILLFLKTSAKLKRKSKLPPGPKPWPIIGNIHQVSDMPHRFFDKLSKIYGPIMSLKLGSVTTIVISSPEIAKQMFTEHDLALSSRNVPYSGTAANHDKLSMVWLPVCSRWRKLRKTVTVQLFTSQRLDATQILRQRKADELVQHARHCYANGLAVDVGKAGFITTLNLLSRTFFSIDLASYDSSKTTEFRDLNRRMLEQAARPNLVDVFPLLKHFDLQGVLKKTEGYFYKMMRVFEEIIDERSKDETDAKDDVLSILLKQFEDRELSLDEIKHMLVDLFLAGTDTTTTTLEWTMTELLRNPSKMVKAQNEIDQVVCKNKSVQESDILKLPYIQAVVKETLRLHPPAPILLPHKAEEDLQLCGYYVPKDTQVFVNVWSIGQNPSVWPNPQAFEPERFLEREIDLKAGRNFELIPFGAGRRICPGLPLAYRMVHLMLANLLHSFNWKHAHDLSPEDIDMEEKFALSLEKSKPLLAVPLPRH